MRKPIDYTGCKFGKLTAISAISTGVGRLWHCECECGNTRDVMACDIPVTLSCGCAVTPAKDLAKGRYTKHGSKHGLTNHRFYDTWYDIKQRCYNPKHCGYNLYGAKGIEMYHDWIDSPAGFITFMESIGGVENDNRTVDRIDNDDGYFPWNIRLSDWKTQANNTSRNRLLTYGARTLTMAQWADELGVPYGRLQVRIQRGWDVERALFGAVGRRVRLIEAARAGAANPAKPADEVSGAE